MSELLAGMSDAGLDALGENALIVIGDSRELGEWLATAPDLERARRRGEGEGPAVPHLIDSDHRTAAMLAIYKLVLSYETAAGERETLIPVPARFPPEYLPTASEVHDFLCSFGQLIHQAAQPAGMGAH